jgi:hypothetical protein
VLEDAARDGARGCFIFGEQHRFIAVRRRWRLGLAQSRDVRHSGSGQEHFERRAFAGLAVHPNAAAALIDDAERHRQAEPRALALLFGREKRFEDAVLNASLDPMPVSLTASITFGPNVAPM